MPETIDAIAITIKTNASGAASGLDEMIASLKKLNSPTNTAVKAMGRLRDMLWSLNKIKVSLEGLNELSKSLESMNGLKLTAIKSLPKALESLSKIDLSQLSQDMTALAQIMQPLGDVMRDIAAGYAALPKSINKYVKAAQKAQSTTEKELLTFAQLYLKIRLVVSAVKSISNTFADWVNETNTYIETVNLFTVSMGEYATEARRYADEVGDALGIDPGTWMKYQGVFQTLATGFGVAADKAAVMSQQLTQLGYDISSFYNIGVEQAMLKVQSGLSGELEPMRRIGYDLSQARLIAEANALGIKKQFTEMTQAEKAYLRYYAILTQVTQVQGDMSRTLEAPSNQLRVLKEQVKQAARALGEIFIPVLNAVLPYAIALMHVIRDLASEFAAFLGFKMPEMDYSSVSTTVNITDELADSTEDVADGIDRANASAKAFSRTLAGFDELNLIGSTSGGAGGAGGSSVGIADDFGWDNLPLPTYDFIGDAVSEKVEKLEAQIKGMIPTLKLFSTLLVGALASVGVVKLINKLKDFIKVLKTSTTALKAFKTAIGLTFAVAGFSLEFSGAREIGLGQANVWSYIKTALGAALGVAGSLLILGATPLGWTIGISAALAVLITGISVGAKERLDASVSEWFFSSGNNTISIESLEDSFRGVLENVNSLDSALRSGLNAYDDYSKKVEAARVELGELISDLSIVSVDDPDLTDLIDKIINKFNELLNYSRSELKEIGLNIKRSLAGSMGEVVAAMGGDVATYMSLVDEMVNGGIATFDDLSSDLQRITAEYKSGKISLDEYTRSSTELYNQLSTLVSDNTSGILNPLSSMEAIIGNIDWDSEESIKGFFENINAAISESRALAEDELKAYMQALDDFERYAVTDEQTAMIEQLRTAANANYSNRLNQIGEEITGLGAVIESDILTRFQNLITETWNATTGSNLSKVRAVQKAALSFYEQYGTLFTDELKKLYGNDSDKLNLFEDVFLNAFMVGHNPSALHKDKQLAEWFNSQYINPALSNATERVKAWKRGEFRETIATLDTAVAGDAKAAGATIGDEVAQGLQKGLETATAAFNKWFTGLSPKLRYIMGKVWGEGGNASLPGLNIPAYANGGYVPNGSLFIANETAPEFVGSIGNRTAVANNTQIVQGIVTGVQHANAEQNMLLREVRDYIRALLNMQGDNTVVFAPSAAAGRVITKSLRLYEQSKGY